MKRSFEQLKYFVLLDPDLSKQFKLDKIRQEIKEIYANKNGWGEIIFKEVDNSNHADFKIIISTPQLIQKKCPGIENKHNLSCADRGAAKIIYLNSIRWNTGGDFESSLKSYRKYLLLHETGHILGFNHHDCQCRKDEKCLAPIMMQQTYKLGNCEFNSEPLDWEIEKLNDL